MRAIGYFRHSDDEGSLHRLEEAFREYCDLYLHQPIQTFGDVAGLKGGDRPAYHRMRDWMRDSGSSFLIVVPNASHLGDDLESSARTFLELEATGASVVCADEEYPDPLQNALQRLGVKGVSSTRSTRIKESMRIRALEGKGLGKPPYGYRIGKDGSLEKVGEESDIVGLMFHLYTNDNLGLRKIAQHLNEKGTTTRRGGRWNIVSIRDILRNPVYVGTYTRFGLRVPKNHPPIVSPKVFRAAQDATMARRPRSRRIAIEPFLLSGMVECGHCGNRMIGATRRQAWRRKDGTRSSGIYRYYQCQSRSNLGVCGYHTWRATRLEDAVLSEVRRVLEAGPPEAMAEASSDGRPDRAQAAHDARVKNAERAFVLALQRASTGGLSIRTLGEYLDQLDRVRAQPAESQEPGNAVDSLAQWEQLDFEARRSFFERHLIRAVVRDDAVEITV